MKYTKEERLLRDEEKALKVLKRHGQSAAAIISIYSNLSFERAYNALESLVKKEVIDYKYKNYSKWFAAREYFICD